MLSDMRAVFMCVLFRATGWLLDTVIEEQENR
jgi:hypothetical protein